jgi:hypothetical protein
MADAVPANRLPFGGTWNGIVGVREVDPTTRTRYIGPLPTSTTVAQINSYLASCPSGQYVELAAGTFSLNGDLTLTTSGKTLRGAVDANGLPTTVLSFSSGANASIAASLWDFGSSGATLFTTVNVGSGATRGSSTLTLSGTPTGLTIGRLMWISAPKNAPTIDGGGWTDWFGTRPFTQVVKVTGVSGNNVSFFPAINADYINSLALQVHYRSASNQVSFSGFENLSLINASGFFDGNVIDISGADQCWVKNCKLYGMAAPSALNAFIYLYCCYGCEIRRCDIAHCSSYGSSTYGLASPHSSGILFVDNYFHDLPNIYPVFAVSGSVFAYNYFTNEPYQSATWLSQIVFFHGSHSHYNLFEGNWIATHYNDATATGNMSHSRNNLFARQRMLGWDAAGPKSANCHCITLENHHDNVTVAACVMGHPGTQTVYNGNGTGGGSNSIFNADSVSSATLVRLGNYNTVNGAIPAAETSALSGGTVAASYLYASKPAWFGDRPWPWVDPSNYTQSNDAQSLPAGYRAINGRDPAAGGAAPTAPTNLRITPSP